MAPAAYNLGVYENLVFSVPPTGRLRRVLLGGGVLSGLLTVALAEVGGLMAASPTTALVVCLGFVGGGTVTALTTQLFPDFPANWGYLIGLVAMALSFGFLVLDVLIGPTAGWGVTVLGSAFVLLTVMAVLVLTAGTDQVLSLTAASVPMPLVMLGLPAAGSRYLGLPAVDLPVAVAISGTVALGLALSVYVHERLIDANVDYIDGSRLTSTLLTGRREDIAAGYPHEPHVHTLRIETGSSRHTLVSPWVHPGPIANFGGGAVADSVINRLNEDGSGFYLKAPSTHEDDCAETAIADSVVSAVTSPETNDEASELLHRTYNDISFHGRRYGDSRVVFMEPSDFGDCPTSVIEEVIDPSDTLVVDRHAYEPGGDGGIRFGSVAAHSIQAALRRFLADLDRAPLYPYRAGMAVDTEGKQICALVEEVNDQRTVVFGSNENEVSDTLRDLEAEMAAEHDAAIVFSTDAHHDIHDLAVRRQVDRARARAVIDEAAGSIGSARAGLGVTRAEETRLLGREYYALQYTINYVLRSFTVSLVGLYLAAAVMVSLGY